MVLKQTMRAELDSPLAAFRLCQFFFRLDQGIENFTHLNLDDRSNDVSYERSYQSWSDNQRDDFGQNEPR
jgi:hypothetical protein